MALIMRGLFDRRPWVTGFGVCPCATKTSYWVKYTFKACPRQAGSLSFVRACIATEYALLLFFPNNSINTVFIGRSFILPEDQKSIVPFLRKGTKSPNVAVGFPKRHQTDFHKLHILHRLYTD